MSPRTRGGSLNNALSLKAPRDNPPNNALSLKAPRDNPPNNALSLKAPRDNPPNNASPSWKPNCDGGTANDERALILHQLSRCCPWREKSLPPLMGEG